MTDFLAPPDLARSLVGAGEKKAALPLGKMFVLGILAGVFIGFAAHLATTIATGDCAYFGLKKFLIGAVFSCGLMLVIIPGSELFTGNNLMTVALLQRRITFPRLLRNWGVVFLGNLVGSLLLAWIIAGNSGLLDGPVGVTAVKIAAGKTFATEGHNHAFFFRAIGCNLLVCLAVMIALSAKDIAGKVWGIFFPIMAFVASGFEHCIANMYFIPAGILARSLPRTRAALDTMSVGDPVLQQKLDGLGWLTMWTQNIGVVTVGNIIGGGVLVGMVYWWLFVRETGEAVDQGTIRPISRRLSS